MKVEEKGQIKDVTTGIEDVADSIHWANVAGM